MIWILSIIKILIPWQLINTASASSLFPISIHVFTFICIYLGGHTFKFNFSSNCTQFYLYDSRGVIGDIVYFWDLQIISLSWQSQDWEGLNHCIWFSLPWEVGTQIEWSLIIVKDCHKFLNLYRLTGTWGTGMSHDSPSICFQMSSKTFFEA